MDLVEIAQSFGKFEERPLPESNLLSCPACPDDKLKSRIHVRYHVLDAVCNGEFTHSG